MRILSIWIQMSTSNARPPNHANENLVQQLLDNSIDNFLLHVAVRPESWIWRFRICILGDTIKRNDCDRFAYCTFKFPLDCYKSIIHKVNNNNVMKPSPLVKTNLPSLNVADRQGVCPLFTNWTLWWATWVRFAFYKVCFLLLWYWALFLL